MKLSEEEKLIILNGTTDAYMYNQYGEKNWMKAIDFLNVKMGMDAFEIFLLLRSKHMRWADDSDSSNRITSNTIKKYLAKERVLEDVKKFLQTTRDDEIQVDFFKKTIGNQIEEFKELKNIYKKTEKTKKIITPRF